MIEIRESVGDEDGLGRRLGALLDGHAVDVGHPFNREIHSLTAWKGDAFLGGAQYQVHYRWCFLMQLAVAPEGRRQGTGSHLIERIEARMRGENALGIWLDTYGFEAAPFYRRHGFVEFGRIPGPSPDLDRIFMRKELEPAP